MSAGRQPMIFYLCADSNAPVGGHKHTYRHVDILVDNGFDAYVLHRTDGFRISWFENNTRVISRRRFLAIHDPRRDYVVIPESLAADIRTIPCRKVVFNKCIYERRSTIQDAIQSCKQWSIDSSVVAVLCVSNHNAEHLRFAYPHLRILTIASSVDATKLAFRPLSEKKKMIACINKAQVQASTLCRILSARSAAGLNNLAGYSWIVPTDLDERQMIELLQDALILIFLNVEEGLPFVVREALACGCLVMGYHHGPLVEFLPSRSAFAYGDLLGIARRIETIADAFPDRMDPWQPLSEEGRAIACKYSPEEEVGSVLDAWRRILAS